jgi:ketosteroid isomerase-like protein
MLRFAIVLALFAVAGAAAQPRTELRREIDALNAAMVAAFKRDPGAVAAFYTEEAAIIGGGQRHQGRAAVDAYWKGAGMFESWTLETLEIGGHPGAPWQYGRSVVHGRSGQTMETYFVGLLRRTAGGDLKFVVDAFTRQRGDSGEADAARATDAYLKAVERADARALGDILDDQFVIVSATSGARTKAQEIADLVPASGATVEYFRLDEAKTRGFGALAVTSGILRWKFGGRALERDYTSIAVKRGDTWKILAQQVTPRSEVGLPAAARSAEVAGGPARRSLGEGGRSEVGLPTVARSAEVGIVEAVANAVAQRYVFPDAGSKIAAHIRERAAKGAYQQLTGGELADALTRDLRVENDDRHLYVQFQPGQSAGSVSGSPSGPVRQVAGGTPASADLMRRRNFFLNRAERLDGNIGYLEVRRFFGLTEDALAAAAAAMAFLAQTDAIIIDVRYAPGGDVRMVDMLASYFFDQVTPTLATYSRSRNETIQRSTLESVPGKRRPDIPVYVLTSRDTGSAAEDFAFLLQQAGRATLVGDRTGGAGHMNAVLGIGGGYSVSVSIGRTFNPKTNQGWEGTGVQPTVRASAADALSTAHRLAISALIDKATDPAVKDELSWTRDAIDARKSPPVVDDKTLNSYAGQYGVRVISFGEGRLWYQRAADAEKIPMVAVSAAEFAMGEGQRLEFEVNGGTAVMRMLTAGGPPVSFTRSPGAASPPAGR